MCACLRERLCVCVCGLSGWVWLFACLLRWLIVVLVCAGLVWSVLVCVCVLGCVVVCWCVGESVRMRVCVCVWVYVCVCVSALWSDVVRVRACLCVCMCVYACVRARVRVCTSLRARWSPICERSGPKHGHVFVVTIRQTSNFNLMPHTQQSSKKQIAPNLERRAIRDRHPIYHSLALDSAVAKRQSPPIPKSCNQRAQTNKQTNKQANTHKQTNKQTNKHTDRG